MALLAKVAGASRLVPAFTRLEQLKSASHYSPMVLADGRSEDMLGWARKLVAGAADLATK